MKAENYYDKYGEIFGISERYSFGWTGYKVRFTNFEMADEWLHTEEYNFSERELVSKTKYDKCKYCDLTDELELAYYHSSLENNFSTQ